MSALESACSGWSSKWRGVCSASWIFIIWAITATWLLPDVHVECVYSVHVVQCCYQNSTHLRLIIIAPLLWLTITPHYTLHTYTHTRAHHTYPQPLSSPRAIMCINSPMSRQHRVKQIKQVMVSSSNTLSHRHIYRNPVVIPSGYSSSPSLPILPNQLMNALDVWNTDTRWFHHSAT